MNLYEFDGFVFAETGHRLVHLTVMEMLNLAYYRLVRDVSGDQRKRIDAALEGRLGEHGGIVIDDPMLPAELQGMEAPSWWSDDHNPMANMQNIDAELG